jgi:MFS family permease
MEESPPPLVGGVWGERSSHRPGPTPPSNPLPQGEGENVTPQRIRPPRHAWIILAGAFTTFAVGAGFMHAYTVFLVEFVRDFTWTRADVSIAYAVGQVVGGVSSPLVGMLVDRLGPRRLVLLGGGLLIAGLAASAGIHALWQTVVLYGLVMTLGANCLGMVVFVPVLSRLFVRQRGMAISILQSANGLGRAFSAPASQLLISDIGWRPAYLVQAAFMTVVVLPLSMLFRRADTVPVAPPSLVAVATRSWTLLEAIRSRQFWLLFLVYLCTGIGSFLVSLHQLAFAVDVGFDKLYAATVLGMGALLSIPGIIITGTVSDYVGREVSAMLTYGVSIVGTGFALLITGPDQHLLLWLHACLFGITWGARGPAITAKTADLFPGRQLGAILGVITIGSGLGSGLGAWGAGFIFDVSGSYRLAFTLSMIAYALGCVAFWALRDRK